MEDVLQDFGRDDVNDEPMNRARRADFFSRIPNRVMTTEPRWMSPRPVARHSLQTFNLLTLALLAAAVVGLAL